MEEKETIDIKTIEQWQKILDESSLYQIEDNETFLDLCRYPGERFEEICSRVLAFFLNPKEKHGFSILWFNALCQTINDKYEKQNNNKKIESEYFYYKFSMEITTEESTSYADITNKRIDIVLKTPTLVIGIENKINAELYNDLKQYKDHIYGKYKDKNINKIFVVLTARDLTNNESKKAKDNGFIVIKYGDLFNNVTSLLGEYVAKCDQKYLSFMLDFIQTVKNRAKIMVETGMDKELNKFFAEKKQAIDKLIELYDIWKEKQRTKLFTIWATHLDKLKTKIEQETDNNKWDISDDNYWIHVWFNNNTTSLRAHFEHDALNNPVGKFHIVISLPKKDEKQLKVIKHQYPNSEEKTINKSVVYCHMHTIELKDFNNDPDAYQEEIINKLKEYYDFLKEITDNIDQ